MRLGVDDGSSPDSAAGRSAAVSARSVRKPRPCGSGTCGRDHCRKSRRPVAPRAASHARPSQYGDVRRQLHRGRSRVPFPAGLPDPTGQPGSHGSGRTHEVEREVLSMTITVKGLDGSQETIADDVLDEVRGRVRGPVLTGDEAGIDSGGRPAWNPMHAGRPALIARCTGNADVVAAVGFAAERGLLVAVRGGGHSVAGLSTVDGGLLIDLSGCAACRSTRSVGWPGCRAVPCSGDVDRETQVVRAGHPAGAGVRDRRRRAHARRRLRPPQSRKYGLACDNLVEAQVVCADGTVRTASADDEPDLFWALRGGGGNFGVVTVVHLRPAPGRAGGRLRGGLLPAGGPGGRRAALARLRALRARTRSRPSL